jgi:hypothetical protein
MENTMKIEHEKPVMSYKGTDHDMKCNGFKYSMGKSMSTPEWKSGTPTAAP